MIFMETACGFKPVIGWPNVGGMRDFANKLLDICYRTNGQNGKTNGENYG